jgi:hypothetical protein
VFVIDGKDQDQQHNNDRMARSEVKTPGVKEATHDKNDEIAKCETTTFRGFGYRGVGGVKDTHDKNDETKK